MYLSPERAHNKSLWQMRALRLIAILVGHKRYRVRLAIGCDPRDRAVHGQRFRIGAGILDDAFLVAAHTVAGLVAELVAVHANVGDVQTQHLNLVHWRSRNAYLSCCRRSQQGQQRKPDAGVVFLSGKTGV